MGVVGIPGGGGGRFLRQGGFLPPDTQRCQDGDPQRCCCGDGGSQAVCCGDAGCDGDWRPIAPLARETLSTHDGCSVYMRVGIGGSCVGI